MSCKLIAYDLVNADSEKYKSMDKLIQENFKDSHKCLNTTWIVNTDKTTDDIYTILNTKTSKEDHILVVIVKPPANWRLGSQETSDWVKYNLL